MADTSSATAVFGRRLMNAGRATKTLPGHLQVRVLSAVSAIRAHRSNLRRRPGLLRVQIRALTRAG